MRKRVKGERERARRIVLCVHLSNGDRFEFFSPIILFFLFYLKILIYSINFVLFSVSRILADRGHTLPSSPSIWMHRRRDETNVCVCVSVCGRREGDCVFVFRVLFFWNFLFFNHSIECTFKLISCNTCRVWMTLFAHSQYFSFFLYPVSLSLSVSSLFLCLLHFSCGRAPAVAHIRRSIHSSGCFIQANETCKMQSNIEARQGKGETKDRVMRRIEFAICQTMNHESIHMV